MGVFYTEIGLFFEDFHKYYDGIDKVISNDLWRYFNLKENSSYALTKLYESEPDDDSQEYNFIEITGEKPDFEYSFIISNLNKGNILTKIPDNYRAFIFSNFDRFGELKGFLTIEKIDKKLMDFENEFKRKKWFSEFLSLLEFELFQLQMNLNIDSSEIHNLIIQYKFSEVRILILAIISNYEVIFEKEISLFLKRNSNKYNLYNLKEYNSLNNQIQLEDKRNSQLWFIVGVNFANGKIFDFIDEDLSASKIATELGNKNYRPYITESLSVNYTSKNIFSNLSKTNYIIDYFNSNKMEIDKRFLNKVVKSVPNQY